MTCMAYYGAMRHYTTKCDIADGDYAGTWKFSISHRQVAVHHEVCER